MSNSVASELAEFVMQVSQLLLACEKQHGIPRGLPIRVGFDDQQRTVTVDVRREDRWQTFLVLDANPASADFGRSLKDAAPGEGAP